MSPTSWQQVWLLRAALFHWKLGLVVLALILSAFHDFVLGPRAGLPGVPSDRPAPDVVDRRVNAVVALAIVLLGLALRPSSLPSGHLTTSHPGEVRNR
jgi:hypothetical protein